MPSVPSLCVLTDNPQVLQRLVVAASCVIFYILAIELPLGRGGKTGMLLIQNLGIPSGLSTPSTVTSDCIGPFVRSPNQRFPYAIGSPLTFAQVKRIDN
jgi:hypothetical protein